MAREHKGETPYSTRARLLRPRMDRDLRCLIGEHPLLSLYRTLSETIATRRVERRPVIYTADTSSHDL